MAKRTTYRRPTETAARLNALTDLPHSVTPPIRAVQNGTCILTFPHVQALAVTTCPCAESCPTIL